MIRENGLAAESVLELLQEKLEDDMTFASGRIIGSMCTEPTRFARLLYSKYLEKNLGDPGLFPGTAKLESEAVTMIGSLISHPHAAGSIVSGGTEANIMALWSARNAAEKERPEAIVPASVHHSFDKAADLLGVKLVKVPTDSRGRVEVSRVKFSITRNTVMIVGIAGTTDLGVIDPISQLSDLAEANDIHFHVDASFGGFVIPFLGELGYTTEGFDFKFPGVSSITIDPHKMGMAPVPAGAILFRDKDALQRISIGADYLAGGESAKWTLLGTRPGASAIVVWAMMKLLGKSGYRQIVRNCMKLTYLLHDTVQKMKNLKPIQEPTINILGLQPLNATPYQVSRQLRERGWAVSAFPSHLRVCVMPHIGRKHVLEFVKELDTLLDSDQAERVPLRMVQEQKHGSMF